MADNRGNRGIEHQQPDTVLQAFRHWNLPNYAIYAGTDQRDCYEGDNMAEAEQNLSAWLDMIANSGTATVYTLRVYGNDINNITTKSPYKGSTTFRLSEPGGNTRNSDGSINVNLPNIGNVNQGVNQQILQLIEGQKQMLGTFNQQMLQAKEDKWDKILAMLIEDRQSKVAEPSAWEKIGMLIIEKPDIIDRVGYIFRPGIYVNQHEQPIAGTENKNLPQQNNQPMAEATITEELTEEQINVLNDRIFAAEEKLAARFGLVALTDMLEKVANMSDGKINALKAFM